MHPVDYAILAAYGAFMLGIGVWVARRHVDIDGYFVGNRRMGAGHVGLSVVATDVGGGFSIGLGGLGFAMGLSGSWLLFTGLVGAWITAVLVIPRVKPLGEKHGWTTFPDLLDHRFGTPTRLAAAGVSALGYAGFVGAQVLAGAKLAAVAFELDLTVAVLLMAVVIVGYTSLGGLEAVILTDTVQWGILLVGLIFLLLPLAWAEAGGLDGIRTALPPDHLSLWAVDGGQLATWFITIVPIWFVGNTLYQRIYATRDVKSAKRAWYLAGVLEWPAMAFSGAVLGMIARVLYPEVESEMGLPMLIKSILPMGATGAVLAVYFAAIMSTADSCLLASVGHIVTDLFWRKRDHLHPKTVLRWSRWLTIVVGAVAILVALLLPKVLDAILLAYSFMVSGLLVPMLAALFWRRATAAAALASLVSGGTTAVALHLTPDRFLAALADVEPAFIALPISTLAMVGFTMATPSGWSGAESSAHD
ncbi:MAG: sodium:solute symporter family protein [Myxococcota bacterium]